MNETLVTRTNRVRQYSTSRPTFISWELADFIMVAMVFTVVFSIVNMPLLPVSPVIILPSLTDRSHLNVTTNQNLGYCYASDNQHLPPRKPSDES